MEASRGSWHPEESREQILMDEQCVAWEWEEDSEVELFCAVRVCCCRR